MDSGDNYTPLESTSVPFSHLVPSNCLQPHELQHARLSCPSPTPELAHTHVHRVVNAIHASHPLPSPSPPAFNLSHHQGLFQWVSSSHQVAKVLQFQLQHQSFQWIFRIDWIFSPKEDRLVWSPCNSRNSQESSLTPQFKSINSSVLSFLYGSTLNPYITTGIWTVGKVIFPLFNMLSRLVIAFLPWSMHLLISWLQSPSAVILEPKRIKAATVSTVSPSICH